MTVIVGHRKGFMVADTLSIYAGAWKTPVATHKTHDFGHSIVAFAGDSSFQQIVKPYIEKAKTPDKLKDTLIEFCQENANMEYIFLLVNNQNDLITGSGGFYKYLSPDLDFYSIGSGSDLTQGYLGALESHNIDITPDACVEAIKYACRYNVTINDITDVVHISSWPRGKATNKRASAKEIGNASRNTKPKRKATKKA